ncbi:MerR-like helix-turn-helix DNA binding domain protein [Mycobacterium phage Shaobing]|nr:MerR-like helix-turn-helix DNA binding domain protein [Mycobacterium phage Shaobing]
MSARRIDEGEAAARLGITRDALRHRRRRGAAPAHRLVGRKIMYDVAALDRYAAALAETATAADNTHVLDMFTPRVGETATADEVRALLRIDHDPCVLDKVLKRHRDELAAAGWDAAAGTFTRQAIIRVALLLRASTSPRAARIAKAAKAGSKVISFDHGPRSQQCASILDRAMALAEQVRDDDPGEVWAALNRLDRHVLTGAAVALAAMVDIDAPGITRYLRVLAGGGAAEGLQRLVPTRETTDGVPLSVLDQIAADDEADSIDDDESEGVA